jgi:uncharacterized surface protein with fasciclin (FAS1) repeats
MSSQDQTTMKEGTGRNESLVPKRMLQTAEGMPQVSRFLEGLRAARMENELNLTGWRTLFAPTNDALDASPNDFWNELMKPENAERLRAIGALHIVRGRQMLIDLKTASTVKSLGGEPVEVSLEGPDGFFGGARIVRPDIPCLNGQIHLIDKLVVREYSYAG